MKKLADMSTAEMLAEYNELTGKSVKRFATRAAGEKQLAAAREKHAGNSGQEPQSTTQTSTGKKNEKRSSAISETWNRPEVAEKRAVKDKVVCNGSKYRSVADAFQKLNLPMAKHIPFRINLKSRGEATFEHDNQRYRFSIEKAAEQRVST